MGRKSSLTDEQWLEIERRVLVDGESVRSIAKEFGVNEAAVRRKINPQKSALPTPGIPLRELAEAKVKAESKIRDISAQISALPLARQQIVSDLARKLTNISEHLGSAAEHSAASAHRLSMLANQQLEKVDDVNPSANMAELQMVAALQKMANASSEIGINLLRANKETVDDLNKGDHERAPSGLEHFYGGQ